MAEAMVEYEISLLQTADVLEGLALALEVGM